MGLSTDNETGKKASCKADDMGNLLGYALMDQICMYPVLVSRCEMGIEGTTYGYLSVCGR